MLEGIVHRGVVYAVNEALADTEKRRAQSVETLDRLHSFLIPRMSRLDTTAVLAAEDRATADIEESKKQAIACMNRCWTARDGNPAACIAKECIKTELDKRIDECRHPTWLPL